jgi:cell division protein FtsA
MHETGMKKREYIAALDLGTSKMLAMVARKNEDGVLSVLGSEKMKPDDCIRRGYIYDTETASRKVSVLVSKLSGKLDAGIKKVYVGIGGQSLRTEYYTVKKEVKGGIIDDEIINFLSNECLNYQPELAEILDMDTVPPEYFLDGRPEENPVGISCQAIEAKFLLILGRPSLKICLEKSIEDKARIEIAGYFISPLATAEAVLSGREKKLGCALVELGAGVTYLSIYKNGFLKYLATIPLGGSVITKDISDKGLTEPEAEELKITRGSVWAESGDEQLNYIIEARANEIVANVIEQIRLSGYESALPEGVIITGGGALLKNMEEFIHHKTGKPARLAVVKKSLVNWEDSVSALIENPANACIFGLLSMGNENCAKEIKIPVPPVVIPVPPVDESDRVKEEEVRKKKKKEKEKRPKTSLLDKMKGYAKNLFDDENEDENNDEKEQN